MKRIRRLLKRLVPKRLKGFLLRLISRMVTKELHTLVARVESVERLRHRLEQIERLAPQIARLELLFSAELDRLRFSEESIAYTTGQRLQNIAESLNVLIERRYGVLSDRLRILQQQADIERVTTEELQLERLSARSQVQAIAAELSTMMPRVEAIASDLAAIGTQVQTASSDVGTVISRLRATPFMTAQVFPVSEPRKDDSSEFDYVGFESIFRGSEEMIKERQRPYLQFIEPHSRVIDFGCGRGEFLELATEADAHVIGVDLNTAMVERCRNRGFDVRNLDALAFLRELEPKSIDVVFSAQFVEHLSPENLYEFFQLSVRVLAPNGTFIAETVNPHSIEALRTFYVDLTHVKPLFPEVLTFFARSAGFDDGRVFYPNGGGFDETVPWNYGEYALVATVGNAVKRPETPANPTTQQPSHPPLE